MKPLIVDARGAPYVGPARPSRWRLLPLLVVVVQCIVFGVTIYRDHARTAAKEQSSYSGYVTFSPSPTAYLDTPLKAATEEHKRSLDRALSSWRRELPPGFKLKSPRLLEGTPSTCQNYEAIACADPRNYQIVIAVRKCDCDMDTILMHEVGHLLGVPHIEDDPLMNPSYAGKLGRPSEQAVALALLHMK